MRHHCINVQDKHCMQNPMVITCPEEDMTISLYMSGTILCDDDLSPTQQQTEDSLQIVLKYPHDRDPQSVCFLKGSHSKEEEDSLLLQFMLTQQYWAWAKKHRTQPVLNCNENRFTVIIDDAKFPYATRITNSYEDVFKGWRQDVTSHLNFTSTERQ